MGELLRHREFRVLLFGQAVSSFGDWMGTLALMYFVLELSGSTTAVGGVLVLRLLPSALGAPLAARAVTRWNRRRVMMGADLVRAGMAFALPVVPWLGWVYFWAFAIEAVGLAFLPARDSSVPVLLGGPDGREPRTGLLALANGVVMGASYGMVPLGAGAFGLINLASQSAAWTQHLQYVAVFWVDALTYLVSFLAIRSLPDLGPRPAEPARARAAPSETARAADPHQEGFLAALRIPLVRTILPPVAMVALGLGALFSLGVVFVQDVLHAGPLGFGAMVACFGTGFALGLVVLHERGDRPLPGLMRAGTALQGVVIIAMGVLAAEAWAFLASLLFGVAATTALISAITHLQDSLQGEARNLALTAFHAVLRAGLALSALAAGALADLIGEVRLGPLGAMAPSQAALIASGFVVLIGSALVRTSPGRPDPP